MDFNMDLKNDLYMAIIKNQQFDVVLIQGDSESELPQILVPCPSVHALTSKRYFMLAKKYHVTPQTQKLKN